MKYTLLALIVALMPLAGCQSDRADAIEDAGDAVEGAYDTMADSLEQRGDEIEGAYDDAADRVDERIEDGSPPGDAEDVIGDGEIIDEPGEPDANELGQ